MTLWPWTRIRELERMNNALNQERIHLQDDAAALRNQVDFLIRSLREIDDIIFSISQCTDWTTMRPRVAQLVDQMTARKVAESDRINSIVVSELRDTYQPPLKQIESK